MDIEFAIPDHLAIPEQDKDETIVVFRKWKDTKDIIALFPEQYEGGGLVNSYMHIGQHGSADYLSVITRTKPAKEWEYEDLFNELISMGYRLSIRTKKPINL